MCFLPNKSLPRYGRSFPDWNFGTDDDALISRDHPIVAKIASILIKGSATGTENSIDHFGFIAEQIAAFKVADVRLKLSAGPRNDLAGLPVGSSDDMTLREVG